MDTRRDFLKGVAGLSTAAALTGCVTPNGEGRFDDALSVFISDLHVGGLAKYAYTRAALEKTVDEILALRPLPRRVVCFGDVALSYGLEVDYATSRPILQRLVDAGIELHLTMGNHDRRSAFLKHWPAYAERPLVPGRFTQVISLGTADLVLLDALKGADDRGERDMGPVEGTIDPAQLAWFESFVAQAKRPFFVGSHQFRDLYIDGEKPLTRAAKSRHFVGWIYGHDHSWCPDIHVASWRAHQILPTLALPSTGLWGDIGHVLFRTDAEGATASLLQRDFYFQTPTTWPTRPRYWQVRIQENQGKSMRFAFERN
ncbi:MAG: metallophosphoesterase [Kiritimatiellae bacterium]|nr:metallophosphoesterase [Kiritimatiellia bacterium]